MFGNIYLSVSIEEKPDIEDRLLIISFLKSWTLIISYGRESILAYKFLCCILCLYISGFGYIVDFPYAVDLLWQKL